MEHIREKFEEIRARQKNLHEHCHARTKSHTPNCKAQITVALGGVAAGLTLALIVWLSKSIITTGQINMSIQETEAASHTNEIKSSSETITQLNERVELLTDTVTKLEDRLMRVMKLTNSNNDNEIHASSSQETILESSKANSTTYIDDSNVRSDVQITTETDRPFVPTHTVKAKLNLRPDATLKSKPTAVLKAGTKVEYISQADDWYFVNTQHNGIGWCSSEYLSPLQQTQHKSSIN